MNEDHPILFWVWAILAAISGSVSSLPLRPYQEMSRPQIALALFLSFTFAVFVGSFVAEWVARKLSGGGPVNLRAFGAMMWFMAVAAHFLLPVMITRAKKYLGKFGEAEAGK